MSRLRGVLLTGAGVLVLGLVLVVGWFWRHPSAFEGYGGWGVGNTHWHAGETAYVGITFPGDRAGGSVTIHGADPRQVADATDATFEYFLCSPRSGPADATIGIDNESALRKECRTLVAADDATMSLTTQQVVVAVTPSGDGVVEFHGLDLRYADGWQNGTQRVGGDVRIRVRP